MAGSEVGALRLRARKTEYTFGHVRPGRDVVDAALHEDGPVVDLPELQVAGVVLRGGGLVVVGQRGPSVAVLGVVGVALREVGVAVDLGLVVVLAGHGIALDLGLPLLGGPLRVGAVVRVEPSVVRLGGLVLGGSGDPSSSESSSALTCSSASIHFCVVANGVARSRARSTWPAAGHGGRHARRG